MPFSRFPGTGAKTVLNTSAVLQLVAADLAADSVGASEIAASAVGTSEVDDNTLTASDLGADSVAASELASGAVTAAGTEIAAGGVVAGNVAVGGVSAANQFASGVVDATAIGENAVGSSELANAILPYVINARLTKPAVTEQLGVLLAPKQFSASGVRLRVGTLPNAGDAFSFNIRNAQVGNLFASDQVFARHPDVTSFRKTLDTGATFTNYTTEVTDAGAGVAVLSSLDTLANGDYVVAGYSEPFAGLNIDMAAAVNGTASVLTVEFWNGSAWTTVGTISDGTISAGATFGQDGVITWGTPPGTWQSSTIDGVAAYYVRLTVSAALDASTEVTEVDIIRDTNYPYLFTPDQNLVVAAGAALFVNCTEADANADGLEIEILGTLDAP